MGESNQTTSFKHKVMNSLLWLGTGTFVGQLISWASTIIVIRLLSPSDYGLFAMASVLVVFLTMISDLGISAAIIQAEDATELEVRQVYGLVVVTSLAGLVISYLCAPLIAQFFNDGKLTLLVRVISINFILIALYVVPQSLFVREMNFQTKAKVDISAQVGSALLTLVLAAYGMGVWSLVFGVMAIHFIKVVGFNMMRPSLMLPSFTYSGAEKMMKFGLTITGDRILYYMYEESDKVIVGRFLGNSLLGFYTVAMTLSAMVMHKVLPIVTQVTFTAYSRIQNDVERISRNILKTSHALAFFAFPLFMGMAGAAPYGIPIILGARWEPIVLPFQLFCLIMPLKALSVLFPPAVQAIGKPKINMVNMGISFLLMAAAFLVGVQWGIIGVCLAWVLAYPVVFVITTVRSLRAIGLTFMDYLTEIRFPCLVSITMISLILLVKSMTTATVHPIVSLVLVTLFIVVFYLGFVGVFKRDEYSKIKALLQR